MGKALKASAVTAAIGTVGAAILRGRKWLSNRNGVPAVVIGSGAGGMAAAVALLERKIPVLMMEAGPLNDPQDVQTHQPGVADESYRTTSQMPFQWYRMRQVGGKMTRWLAHCPRMSHADFNGSKVPDHPWPLTYEELAPYYTRVERLLGVVGSRDGIDDLPDGEFVGAFAPRVFEQNLHKQLIKAGISVTSGRYAAYPESAVRSKMGQVAIQRDPSIEAAVRYFRPVDDIYTTLLKNPNFSLLPLSTALRLELDQQTNRIEAISYYDESKKRQKMVRAKSVVIAAGCLESTKLLLNSTSSRYAAGIGNSSGTLGKYLTDHSQALIVCPVPDDFDIGTVPGSTDIPRPERFGGFIHCYGRKIKQLAPELLGMYSFQLHARKYTNETVVALNGMGFLEPREANSIKLTSEQTPKGVPVPFIQLDYSPDDLARQERMVSVGQHLLGSLGQSEVPVAQKYPSSVHYAGTCRMGSDPETSMLDSFGESHEVKNLYVADASSFVTNPEKNPTLTLMALAWRAGHRLAQRLSS